MRPIPQIPSHLPSCVPKLFRFNPTEKYLDNFPTENIFLPNLFTFYLTFWFLKFPVDNADILQYNTVITTGKPIKWLLKYYWPMIRVISGVVFCSKLPGRFDSFFHELFRTSLPQKCNHRKTWNVEKSRDISTRKRVGKPLYQIETSPLHNLRSTHNFRIFTFSRSSRRLRTNLTCSYTLLKLWNK